MKLSKQEFDIFIKVLKELCNFSNDLCKVFDTNEIVLDDYLATLFDFLAQICGYKDGMPEDSYIIRYLFEGYDTDDLYERVCEEIESV